MIKRILYIVNMIFVLIILGTYAGSYIRPESFSFLSLFNYLYPFALLVNLLFCILWAFWKWKFIIVPLATIFIGLGYIPRLVGFSGERTAENETEKIKVMTYNVGYFSHETQQTSELRQRNCDSIFNVIKNENPDIVCLQEYSSAKKGQHAFHRRMIEELGYDYHYSPIDNKWSVGGNAIYSKYKIDRSGCLFPMIENFNSFTFADIKKGTKTFRVYNLHLASYKILPEEKEQVGKIASGDVLDKETSKSIVGKLISANKIRSEETRQITNILQQTKHRYLLVGDFNSTPFSYTYHEFSKYASDSFCQVGSGFSGTYVGPLPSYRIDYIFCSEGINPLTYLCADYVFSDHKPVIIEFELSEK